MATIDSNGVLIYQDTDNYTPIQTALNLAQSNLSSILGANTQIVRVSSVGDRNAKATARGSISKANPFVAWRADAADGLQLEYTTNGTTWRTLADKEYYDSQGFSRIQRGTATLNISGMAAGSVGVNQAINFPEVFTSAPTVTLSLAGTNRFIIPIRWGTSTTGFSITPLNAGTAAVPASTNISLDWIAVGT